MLYLLKLAFANLLRERRRTALTLIVLSLGMIFYIFMTGFVKGIGEKQVENLIKFETAHFKVRAGDYDDEKPYSLKHLITNPEDLRNRLEKVDGVVSTTERILFMAQLDNGIDSIPVEAIAVDEKTDPKVFALTNYVSKGGLKKKSILLGSGLAEDLNIVIGDYVYLTFRDRNETLNSLEMSVSGLIQAADPDVNNSTVFMNIDEAKQALDIQGCVEIAVLMKNQKMAVERQPEIQQMFPEYQVIHWKKLGEYFLKFAQADAAGGYMFVVFIGIIAIVGIVNTMLISVYEKQQEIGTLKALGMTDGDILWLFVFEGFWIGTAASLIGLILGGGLNILMIIYGINFDAFTAGGSASMGYNVMGVVKSRWDIPLIIGGVVFTVIASSLASLYPAKKATEMQPVECLRNIQ